MLQNCKEFVDDKSMCELYKNKIEWITEYSYDYRV